MLFTADRVAALRFHQGLHPLRQCGHDWELESQRTAPPAASDCQVAGANLEGTRSAAVLALWQDLGAQSSVVHFERELDFTLVILTVAYRSDFSEVSRVEEIE